MNPYKVLQLEPGADKQAVKKAYFKLIRQYPPEKEPEKFKEIREAYEYLQEETNLVNVQKVAQLPEEFIKPYYQALEWMKEHEYDKAVALCETVLNIVELLEFQVLLGKAYILNDNSGKAVKLWEELCKQHRDNMKYQEQLGDAYSARGWNKKAFQVYYTLYERKVESLSFYNKLIDIATLQGAPELISEICKRIFEYYKQIEKHTREDAESMSSILYIISDYMSQKDCLWLLNHSDEILKIITEVPMERTIYESTLLHNYANLIEIFEQDEVAEPVVASYREYISANEKSISEENQYQLKFVKVQLEQIKMNKDSLIHEITKKTSDFWYGMRLHEIVAEKETSEEFHIMQLLMDKHYDDSSIYEILLYMVNDLKDILPCLQRVKEEYPILRQAMGDYLDEMISCSSQDYLFRKYEQRYKKLMGYPSGARLIPSSKEEEDYDSYENGTYRREGTKTGRNDPCPCGSGKKYKKCCGR